MLIFEAIALVAVASLLFGALAPKEAEEELKVKTEICLVCVETEITKEAKDASTVPPN